MRPAQLLVIGFVGVWLSLTARAGAPGATTRPAASAAADAIAVIEAAEDAIVAISAYARGRAAAPEDLKLHKAFLRRMTRAKLPGLAHEAARKVVSAEPDNGLAWAVIAHVQAAGGRLEEALWSVVQAAGHRPDDPFVLQTAGALLGRYERQKDRVKVPKVLAAMLKRLAGELAGRKAFDEAYRAARPASAPAPAAGAPQSDEEVLRRLRATVGSSSADAADRADRAARDLDFQMGRLRRAISGSGGGGGGGTSTYSYTYINTGYPYGRYGVPYYAGRPYGRYPSSWAGSGVRITGGFSFGGGRLRGTFRVGSPLGGVAPLGTGRVRGAAPAGRAALGGTVGAAALRGAMPRPPLPGATK